MPPAFRHTVHVTGTAADGTPGDVGSAPKQAASRRSTVVKSVLSGVVTLATLVIVFMVIFPQFADYDAAWAAIQAMSAGAVVALLLATLLNLIVYAWPFPAASRLLRYGPSFVVRQTGFSVSNGIPGVGGAISVGLQYRMLATYGVPGGLASSVIAVTSTWNILITLALPVLGVLALAVSGVADARAAWLAVLGVAVIAVIVGVLALVLRSESGARTVGHLAERVVGPVVRVFRRNAELDLVAPLLSFRASSVEVVTGRWVLITVANLAMQLTSWLVLFVGLRALEVGSVDQVTWSQSLAAFSFARIASFIPLTPGGLGTVDLALSTLLVSFGATNDDALAATLLWRAGTYFPPMITGLVTFLAWRVHQRRAARAA